MFCFDPNPLCNGGIHTQHQFSPAISRNLIVDFGYFHWTLLCPTNFLAEREKCFQNTKKEWGNFFEWSKSRQTTHNRFLCITVSLEKKLLTFWNIVVYHTSKDFFKSSLVHMSLLRIQKLSFIFHSDSRYLHVKTCVKNCISTQI